MPNNWVQALKVFNEGKSEWCIPRKGSKEYDDIKRFMYGEIFFLIYNFYLIIYNNQKKTHKLSIYEINFDWL
jgi:hypothetical protein